MLLFFFRCSFIPVAICNTLLAYCTVSHCSCIRMLPESFPLFSQTCCWRIYSNVCFPATSISFAILLVGIVRCMLIAKINKFCCCYCLQSLACEQKRVSCLSSILIDTVHNMEVTTYIATRYLAFPGLDLAMRLRILRVNVVHLQCLRW